MTSAIIEEKANLWPAVLLFSVTYLLVSALVTGVLIAFDLNSNTGVSIGLLVAATAVAARKFVIDHRRAAEPRRAAAVRASGPPPRRWSSRSSRSWSSCRCTSPPPSCRS